MEGSAFLVADQQHERDEAVAEGLVSPPDLVGPTDEELLYAIGRRAEETESGAAERLRTRWLPDLWNRRLPKRALELTAADLGELRLPSWLGSDPKRKREFEDGLAATLGLEPGEVVVDYPAKVAMFQLNLLLQRRSGEVARVGAAGLPGVMDLPRVAEELYGTARVLRIFTFRRRSITRDAFLAGLAEKAGS